MTEQRAYRKAYLVQYLNLATLSDEPTRLIRLMHHRIFWYPKDWLAYDNAQIQLVWHQGRVEERRANGCIMMTGHEYGVWKPFNQGDVHKGSAYGAPRALLILEAQELIMCFLLKAISEILAGRVSAQDLTHTIETSTTHLGRLDEADGCRDWSKVVSSELAPDSAQPWSPFGAMQHNPFAEPPRFNIDSIIEIAENQTLEMQDELWLLQTEPNYFYERVKCLNEWWYDKVEGLDKIEGLKAIKHNNIAYFLTIGAYQRARDWQWILQQCRIVKQERETYMRQRHTGPQLPKQYEQALGGLSFLISRAWEDCQTSLESAITRSRVFGSSYKTLKAGNYRVGGATTPGATIGIAEYGTLWDRDRIGWCLYWLTNDREDNRTFPATSVLQYLEQILSTKSSSPACTDVQKQALDQEMRSYISNLTALDQMSALLDLHRPAIKVPSSLFDINEDQQVRRVLQQLYNAPKTTFASGMALGSACFPIVKFIIPKGTKNYEWLTKRDLAHKALANLWRRARGEFRKLLEENGVTQVDIDPQLNEMSQCESPEFHSRLQEERERIESRINTAHDRKYARSILQTQQVPEFGVPIVAARTNEKKEIQITPRLKNKSRPEVVNIALGPEIIAQKTEYEEPWKARVLYTFKKQSKPHRLISRVFPYDDDDPQQPGQMSWQDFVAAWRNLGCKVEHYGGSAHTFRGNIFVPSDPEQPQRRNITVHRPHPDDTLSSVMLHGIGRRLSRRFGWERGNFAFTK